MMNAIQLAYIGCGAVVERSHLPAISAVKEISASVLIDFNSDQTNKLSEQYSVEHVGSQFTSLLDQFDLAVVATPSASHFQIGKALLEAGKHVLIEKPLSIRYSEAEQLVNLAEQTQRVLAVSLVRRYLPHFKLFKSLLDNDIVGKVRSFSIEEGGVFNWPVQSVDFYRPEKSGGGVLMDNGAHLLDLMLWWLGGYQTVIYTDDAQGGVEAECHLEVTLQSGATGNVIMSRLRQLSNSIVVRGDKGEVSMNLASGAIDLSFDGAPVVLSGHAVLSGQTLNMSTVDLFEAQYHDLAKAIHGHDNAQASLVLGRACLDSISLIEECYQSRKPLTYRVA